MSDENDQWPEWNVPDGERAVDDDARLPDEWPAAAPTPPPQDFSLPNAGNSGGVQTPFDFGYSQTMRNLLSGPEYQLPDVVHSQRSEDIKLPQTYVAGRAEFQLPEITSSLRQQFITLPDAMPAQGSNYQPPAGFSVGQQGPLGLDYPSSQSANADVRLPDAMPAGNYSAFAMPATAGAQAGGQSLPGGLPAGAGGAPGRIPDDGIGEMDEAVALLDRIARSVENPHSVMGGGVNFPRGTSQGPLRFPGAGSGTGFFAVPGGNNLSGLFDNARAWE